MTGADLRLAITGPAAAAGLDIEAGLVETILSELRSATGSYDPGALPLVSQIMLAVWEHREGRRLTLRGYARTDGVTDAVASSADAAYTSLAVPARGLVRQVFHQLVDVSPTGHLARRTAARADLYHPGSSEQRRAKDVDRGGADDADRPGDIDQILDAFARRRLIVVDAGTVQIGHDILLEAWPRLREWLEPDLTGYALYSQLRDAAAEWARHDHAASYLYQGERLAAVTQVRSRWEASPDRYPRWPEHPQNSCRPAAPPRLAAPGVARASPPPWPSCWSLRSSLRSSPGSPRAMPSRPATSRFPNSSPARAKPSATSIPSWPSC